MDPIRTLCDGQNRQARRRILAAYYIGAAAALKSPPALPKTDTGHTLMFLQNQAE